MGLPSHVEVFEVGPREGFQIEKRIIPTEEKVSLINSLNATGIKNIEVTSLVSPKWVPQMADADEVLKQMDKAESVSYYAAYLNFKGLERALLHDVNIVGKLSLSASNTFSQKNMNKTIDDMLNSLPQWIEAYQENGIAVKQIGFMAAFGCNYEGYIHLTDLMDYITKVMAIAKEHGEQITKVRLADTMGWANPEQMKETIYEIKNKWPHLDIGLHLHDTRGLGLANAFAALQEGVTEFDTAIAGLGGCPFAKVKGAPGNICTEDFAFMCEEQGIDTGLDIEALLESAALAEQIIGRELPGHLLRGGRLMEKRPITWKQSKLKSIK